MLTHIPIMQSRIKHMEINLFFVRDKVMAKQLKVVHSRGNGQLTNMLTKPLSSIKYLELRHKLMVVYSPVSLWRMGIRNMLG